MKRRSIFRWGVAVVVLLAGCVAVLQFSPLVRIRTITAEGMQSVPERLIVEQVKTGYEGKLLGRHYRVPSLFNFNSAKARSAVLSAFPQISDAAVVRDWPHDVRVSVTERTLAGAWCRRADGGYEAACRYWDRTGARWGSAVESVGPLLLLVVDERADDALEPKFLAGILASVDEATAMGLDVRRVVLPDAEPGGVRLDLAEGYELRMDALGDPAEQLATLQVFLGEKAKDPSFKPAYLDLRTPGRVYFR